MVATLKQVSRRAWPYGPEADQAAAKQPALKELPAAFTGLVGELSGERRLLAKLARDIGNQLFSVPDKLRLQVDPALVCQDNNRPQAIRQFMPKLPLAVINIPDAGVGLNQFRQIAHIPYEAKRKFFCVPDAPPPLSLELFVEVVQP